MGLPTYQPKRVFIGRLKHGADLLQELTRIVNEENIRTGSISGIGGLMRGAVAFYNQQTRQYERIELNESLEITSLAGNVSVSKERPFPHVHITLSDKQGRAFGGHLTQGCEIWACEVVIQEFEGGTLAREFDETTGLPLWHDSSIL
jgi:predicted DNA-binding protein with PD1-like motif